MFWNKCASPIALLLCGSLLTAGISYDQQPAAQANAAPQRYKLTVLQNASTSKRVKKNRVSAEAVVMVTDTNDVPVAGITVTFLLPQYGGGATFANGGNSAAVTTNASGVASSGSITAQAGSSLSVSVSAAVPGGALTATVPVSTAVAAAAAGISTAAIVGIVAGVAAVGAIVAVKVLSKSSSSSNPSSPTTPSVTTGAIGAVGSFTFGHP
jgi:cobalamin biosynthesis Mg chelatase CobN